MEHLKILGKQSTSDAPPPFPSISNVENYNTFTENLKNDAFKKEVVSLLFSR
jgi:hypothetical protein